MAKQQVITKIDLGQALDIDSLLARGIKNRISRVGIEMEGGWKEQPTVVRFERDGSVFKTAGDDGRYGRRDFPGILFGEVNSGIIQPAAIPMFMKKFHPNLIDTSCGLHVHMSFKTIGRYQTLTDPAYPATILKYMTKWAEAEGLPQTSPLWSRLKGESTYCQLVHWPDAQMANDRKDFDQKKTGHRYTAVNYCWRGGSQKTIEVRLLPMFDDIKNSNWERGARGVQRILDITNASLVLLTNRKMCKESGKLMFRDEDSYSESVVEVL